MADNRARVIATVDSAGDGTDWLQVRSGYRKFFSVSIAGDGSWDGVVTLQRKLPQEDDSDAKDVAQFPDSSEDIAESHGHWDYRLYVKSGEYTAGAVTLELNR